MGKPTIDQAYLALLKQDVAEYETKTRLERLKRLDISVQELIRTDLPSEKVTPKEALEFFADLDTYLEENGVTVMQTGERIIKGRAFFTENPGMLEEHYQSYCDARGIAWDSLG